MNNAGTSPAPFAVVGPARQSAPVVFASPHSGQYYPDDLMAATMLPELLLRRTADNFVDEIFSAAPDHGAPLIGATYARAYLDLNREPWELDPQMFSEALPGHINATSLRVAGGLGTIPRLAADGREIYHRRLDFAEIRQRLNRVYFPYHHSLARMIEDTQLAFGRCLLVDCHSMPSISGLGPGRGNGGGLGGGGDQRADIVLGDRFGSSCAPELTDCVHRTLSDLGLRVQRNNPYAGGFTTYHYGRPGAGVHVLQIEINRRLYMDEVQVIPTPGMERIRQAMSAVIAAVCRLPAAYFETLDTAAE